MARRRNYQNLSQNKVEVCYQTFANYLLNLQLSNALAFSILRTFHLHWVGTYRFD